MDKKKVIIIGQGSSGKDFLKAELIKKGYKAAVSYTTRPPRTGETNAVNYYYVDEPKFKRMIDAGEFKEWNCFGKQKWYYGTSNNTFQKANLFVMTPSALKAISPEDRKNAIVIFLDMPEDVRMERLKKRNDADTPENRIQSDRETFKDFADYDIKITDSSFDVGYILKKMSEYDNLQSHKSGK